MNIALIGLGSMGYNLAKNMVSKNYQVNAFEKNMLIVENIKNDNIQDLYLLNSIQDLVDKTPSPRVIMLSLPADKIDKCISEVEIKNFKMFFVSSLFDIETLHKQSQENNNVLYEPVMDPYSNLPEPPKMPRAPIITQDLQRYKMTSHIRGKNSEKEKKLNEHSKKEKQFHLRQLKTIY